MTHSPLRTASHRFSLGFLSIFIYLACSCWGLGGCLKIESRFHCRDSYTSKTLNLLPVINQSSEPEIGAALTHSLQTKLLQGGVSIHADGVNTLQVTLTNYQSTPIAYQKADTRYPAAYLSKIQAHVTFCQTHQGVVSSGHHLIESSLPITAENDSIESVRVNVPGLAEDLAQKIYQAIFLKLDQG